jgi:hypothetical protein
MSRLAVLALVLTLAASASASADADANAARDGGRVFGKPRAPVTVEWQAAESPGRLVAVVRPESDYERLELVRVRPSGGDPARQVFGPGRAGDALRVEWSADPEEVRPRMIVIMTVDGQRLKRASSPSAPATLPGPGAPADGRVDEAAGLRIMPATREPEN